MRNTPPQLSKRPGSAPCCSKEGLKRGPWTAEEDELLVSHVRREGEGRWRTLPKRAGLQRCGKSCRLRWMNYLRPSIKRGGITADEEDLILRLHRLLGNRWSLIAGRIPGRTDNEIKNYWNTHLRKRLISQGIHPQTHRHLDQELQVLPAPAPNPNPNPSPNPSKQPLCGDHAEGFPQVIMLQQGMDLDHSQGWQNLDGSAGLPYGDEDVGGDCSDEDFFSSLLNSLITTEDAAATPQHQLSDINTEGNNINQIASAQVFGFGDFLDTPISSAMIFDEDIDEAPFVDQAGKEL